MDGIRILSWGLTRSWQISLLMLVTLPLMALGAVLMATAVEDAMNLSSKPSMHASFCSDLCSYNMGLSLLFVASVRLEP